MNRRLGGRLTEKDHAMLASSDLVAFVATTDLQRARAFYAGVLGLPVVAEDPFACTLDAHGTHIRLTPVDEAVVAPYTVLGWSVADISATVRALTEAGVVFQTFPGMDQDDDGVWRAPGGARVAWFNDIDGHTLSVTEDAP
jgi:catechol 2,3-dioxygenase-like lactoylglutathione lyase family enzyme